MEENKRITNLRKIGKFLGIKTNIVESYNNAYFHNSDTLKVSLEELEMIRNNATFDGLFPNDIPLEIFVFLHEAGHKYTMMADGSEQPLYNLYTCKSSSISGSEREKQEFYRLQPFERIADEFAKRIYHMFTNQIGFVNSGKKIFPADFDLAKFGWELRDELFDQYIQDFQELYDERSI